VVIFLFASETADVRSQPDQAACGCEAAGFGDRERLVAFRRGRFSKNAMRSARNTKVLCPTFRAGKASVAISSKIFERPMPETSAASVTARPSQKSLFTRLCIFPAPIRRNTRGSECGAA
jgi:hypothetical protein